MFKSKLLWRMAVIILVVAFSAATIAPTQSTSSVGGTSSGDGTIDGGTGSGGGTTGGGTTTKPTFPENSYHTIYAPFVNWEDKSEVPEANKIRVSWQDTNTIDKIWKKQIEGGKNNDGKRFIIRDANNNQREPLTGSYYFFDKNFNIVYYRQGKGSLLVRKFIRGTIVNFTGYSGKNQLIGE